MANYTGLDKGFPVLSTYNSSAAAGVLAYRCVKYSVSGGVGYIDLQTTAGSGALTIGIVQENVDAAKVATGKVVADVRMQGVSKVLVTTGTNIVLGSKVMCTTSGGVILAATSGSAILGIVVGLPIPGTAPSAGDLIDVMLTPGLLFP